ncbi:hypothetical protein, partial [Moorena sp. SIO3A5]|uniref:hypothetical protein n=1 Tax=Moorena sp. SIO3A5 TaxID=2607822 RepID=UPI0025795FD6
MVVEPESCPLSQGNHWGSKCESTRSYVVAQLVESPIAIVVDSPFYILNSTFWKTFTIHPQVFTIKPKPSQFSCSFHNSALIAMPCGNATTLVNQRNPLSLQV